MGDFVGVTAFSMPILSEVKQQALLFDRIAVPGLSVTLEDNPSLAETNEHAELRWLSAQGLLFPATISVNERQAEELRRVESLFLGLVGEIRG